MKSRGFAPCQVTADVPKEAQPANELRRCLNLVTNGTSLERKRRQHIRKEKKVSVPRASRMSTGRVQDGVVGSQRGWAGLGECWDSGL